PLPLAELQPGMRVDLIHYKDSETLDEVQAFWPSQTPKIKAVDAAKRTITFPVMVEGGVSLDVSLPVAAGATITLDGAPAGIADVPLGYATWLSLSGDKKSLTGIAAFSKAYDL